MDNRLIVRDPNQLSEWAIRIDECHGSGKTVVEWCRQNGINPKTYYYWNKKVARMAADIHPEPNSFYEISPAYDEGSDTGNVIGRITVGSIKAEVCKGADVETLVSLIKAIQLC